MDTTAWRGFVIGQSENTYTIISERDKKTHTLDKKDGKIVPGFTVMPDGHICNVDDVIFNNSMLYSACREYSYDLRRHKKRRQARKGQAQTESE